MRYITDADYAHAKRVCKSFEIKHLRVSLFLCPKQCIIFSRNKWAWSCKRNCRAPGIAWKAVLKNTKVKFDLLTDVDMLLMTEKGIRGRTYHSIYRYAKANNKYMKNYDKKKNRHIFNIWM